MADQVSVAEAVVASADLEVEALAVVVPVVVGSRLIFIEVIIQFNKLP